MMFCVGRRDAYIVIGMRDEILIIRLFGDTLAQDILAALQIAHSMGWLKPDCRSLIDIRCFIGSIDWVMLRDLTKLAPWSRDGARRSSYCAYLFGDSLRDWFLSIVAAIYPGAGHRRFDDEPAALAWLAAIDIRKNATTLAMGPHSG
jgi:hypothetical protein